MRARMKDAPAADGRQWLASGTSSSQPMQQPSLSFHLSGPRYRISKYVQYVNTPCSLRTTTSGFAVGDCPCSTLPTICAGMSKPWLI
jgi:hypothetical protein